MEEINISIDEIKKHLEDEAEFIVNRIDDKEVIEAIERMRCSYFIYYNMLNQCTK